MTVASYLIKMEQYTHYLDETFRRIKLSQIVHFHQEKFHVFNANHVKWLLDWYVIGCSQIKRSRIPVSSQNSRNLLG